MDNNDPEWMEEKKQPLPEAPMSIHIDSYLEGFHIGWTKRLDENSLASQVLNIKAFIRLLKDDGFQPSWNIDTNEEHNNTKKTIDPLSCDHDDKESVLSKSQKNPGRWFYRCKKCTTFLGWTGEKRGELIRAKDMKIIIILLLANAYFAFRYGFQLDVISGIAVGVLASSLIFLNK